MSDQPSQSPADRLRELKGLHDDGVVSDAEFEEMRAPLVKELGLTADTTPEDASVVLEPEVDTPEQTAVEKSESSQSRNTGSTKKAWLFIVGPLLLVLALLFIAYNYRSVEHWAFPERAAYDAGVEQARGPNPSGETNGSCVLLRTAKATTTPAEFESRVAGINALLAEFAASSDEWEPWHDIYYTSGFWDEATRTCPELFDNPKIAGRP